MYFFCIFYVGRNTRPGGPRDGITETGPGARSRSLFFRLPFSQQDADHAAFAFVEHFGQGGLHLLLGIGGQAAELAVGMYENKEETAMPADYSDTNVSVKVVKLIQSYTDIVNRTVWLKD